MEVGEETLNFLDVTLYKENNKIERDIYHKNTDSFSYVPFSSCHPRHVTRNIPYVLAKRIRRIISNENLIKTRLSELKVRLIKLGYPHNLIKDAIRKSATENETVNDDNTTQLNRTVIPFIKTYNPNEPDVYRNMITPAFSSLQLTPSFKNYTIKNATNRIIPF